MSCPVISVENLSKRYILGHQQRESYTCMRDVIAEKITSLARRFSPKSQNLIPKNKEEFWALSDVSFSINQGDRVGIIGRNGAGKSTLLKILSRITEPTSGKIGINGRVASLLEVGTGFHPELTGRENIYLNGAILGMSRVDIKRKFDEIVAFAEVERFLDTPVKHYSSGMYVRLAFAVAAHLEPEILIVDEVLAVGDAQFQKKCLGKMEEVGKEGRTVLFVSHNMNAIEQLCSRALLIERGQTKKYEYDVRSVIKEYLFSQENELATTKWVNTGNKLINEWFNPLEFYIADSNGDVQNTALSNNSDSFVYIKGEIKQVDPSFQIGYAIYNQEGSLLYWSCQTDGNEEDWPSLKEGDCIYKSQIPKRLLNEGVYRVELLIALYFKQWISEPGVNAPSIHFTIQGGLSDSPYWMIKRPGMLAPVLKWHLL
jgi:lipopolysaccharide transport system ATP-binding protein